MACRFEDARNDLEADLYLAIARAERAERERDEAVALIERVCANEHDWGALETAMRAARKWLAAYIDVGF